MDDTDDGREPRVRRLPFTWLGLLLGGWVLYEVTAQPALGTALVCLKFGWEDFRTARWLRRTDPDRARGRACFWLYAAWGLCKTTFLAYALCFAIPLGIGWTEQLIRHRLLAGNGGLTEALIGVAVVTVVGFLVCSLATARALWLARQHGLRLWVNSSVNSARRRGWWPPTVAAGETNRLSVLLVPLFLSLFMGSVLMVAWTATIVESAVGRLQGFLAALLPYGTLVVGIAVPLRVHLSAAPITAASPAECWPPDELAPLPDDPVRW